MFFVEVLLLLIIFLVGCAAAGAGAGAAYNISTEQREVPATVSSFYVSVLYTATLRTSIAAVVLGCFYFRPLDCDASILVVDCAAVETGCMLKKYVTSPLLLLSFESIILLLLLLRRDMHFLFERSEFLIATCKKKKTDSLCVYVRLILVLVLGRQIVYGQNTVYLCLSKYIVF